MLGDRGMTEQTSIRRRRSRQPLSPISQSSTSCIDKPIISILPTNGRTTIAAGTNDISFEYHVEKETESLTAEKLKAESKSCSLNGINTSPSTKMPNQKLRYANPAIPLLAGAQLCFTTGRSNFLPAVDLDVIADPQRGCYLPVQMGFLQTR